MDSINPSLLVNTPGTIVRDIEILMSYIGTHKIISGGKNANLPLNVLPDLNQSLSNPIQMDLKRAMLKDYPNIAGPYILIRVMDLVKAHGKTLVLNEKNLEFWQTLNPVEKYFALIEAWLIFAEHGVLGSDPNWRSEDQYREVVGFLESDLKRSWKKFYDDGSPVWDIRNFTTWNAQLAMRFGLMEVKEASRDTNRYSQSKGWNIGRARKTQWGVDFLEQLKAFVLSQGDCFDNLASFFDLPEDVSYGFFKPAFQPAFPDWKKSYVVAEMPSRNGYHIFKVVMTSYVGKGSVWRRLVLNGTDSLDILSDQILEAFNFDDDQHLYMFSFKDSVGKSYDYFHPYSEDAPLYATDVQLQDMHVPDGGIIKYLFDFGDRWRFDVVLEKVIPYEKVAAMKYGVIESMGTPPKQY